MKTDTLLFVGGCAGSFAAPSENRVVWDPEAPWRVRRVAFNRELYGGRTTCYLLRHQDTFIVVDQGSGIDVVSELILGMLRAEGRDAARVFTLFTHFHDDHVGGIQQNALLFRREIVVQFIAPDLTRYRLDGETWPQGRPFSEKVLADYFNLNYFPVGVGQLPARIEHQCIAPGESCDLGSVHVQTLPLTHPGGCVGYRFEIPRVGAVVIATDYEPPPDPDPVVMRFFEGARLLFVDMQYDDEEYEGRKAIGPMQCSRVGWGHGTPRRILPTVLACQPRPERVRVVHHDPRKSDMELRLFYEHSLDVLGELTGDSSPPFDWQFAHGGDVYWL